MGAVMIRPEHPEPGEIRFRAICGDRESTGRTMGEALDALAASWSDIAGETAVLIQRVGGDRYFTDAQHQRLQELLSRRDSLSAPERSELEALIDAELDATVSRSTPVTPSP